MYSQGFVVVDELAHRGNIDSRFSRLVFSKQSSAKQMEILAHELLKRPRTLKVKSTIVGQNINNYS